MRTRLCVHVIDLTNFFVLNLTQMVFDAGKLVEFGSPRELLRSRDGLFMTLVQESKDRDKLLGMVKDDA